MGILNVISRDEGCVGDIRKVGKFTYVKARNGKWGLVYDKPVLKLLRDLHIDGLTNVQIAQHTGIPRPRVTKVLRELGLVRHLDRAEKVAKSMRIHSDKNLEAEVLRLYRERHFPCWLIAQVLDIGYRPVYNLVRSTVGIRTVAQASESHVRRTGVSKGYTQHKNAIEKNLKRSLKTFKEYTRAVRALTYVLMYDYQRLVDPDGLKSHQWHADHQFSIYLGFYRFSKRLNSYVPRTRPIPLQVICHPANLKIISASENAVKGHAAAVSYGKLLRRIEEFDSLFGPVFEDFDYAEEWDRIKKT